MNDVELLQATRTELAEARARIAELELALQQNRPPSRMDQILSHIARHSTSACHLIDADGLIEFVTPSIEHVLGYDPEVYRNTHFAHYVHTDHLTLLRDTLQAAVAAHGERVSLQAQFRHANDSWIWVEITFASQLDNPDVRGILASIHDITENKLAHIELEASAERFRLLADSIPDALYVMTTGSAEEVPRMVAVNQRACEMLGYTRQELLTMTLADVDDPEKNEPAAGLVQRLLAGEHLIFVRNHRHTDGTIIPVEVHARMGWFQGEQVIISLAHDIRKRESIENDLRMFEAAVRQTEDGILIVNASEHVNPQVLFANQAYARITGYALEEIVHHGLDLLATTASSDPEPLGALLDAIRALRSFNGKVQHQHKSGAVTILQWSVSPVVDAHGSTEQCICVARDVTEQEQRIQVLSQLTTELESSRNDMQAILDSMQDALMSIRLPDREVLFASASLENVFGYPLERFIEDPMFFTKVVHPDDLQMTIAAMQQGLREGFVEHEHRMVFPDGSVRWLHRRAWVNYDEHGNPIRVNDSAHDITERKLAEEALRASESRYRAVVEDQTELVCRYDKDLRITFANEPYSRAFGLAADEIVGHSIFEWIPEQDHEGQLAYLETLTKENTTAVSVHRSVMPDGSLRWMEWKDRALLDAEGTIVGYQGVGRDVTERVEAQQAMVASETKQRAILEAMPDLVFHLQADGTMVDFHGPIQDLAIAKDELLGKTIDDFLSSPLVPGSVIEDLLLTLERARKTHELAVLEYELPQAGSFEARIVPIGDSDDLIVIVRNITEAKQAQESLRNSEARYRSLIDSSDASISMLNADGKYLFVNAIAAAPFGGDPDQLVGKDVSELFGPDQAENILRDARAVIESGQGMVLEPEVIVNGESCWFRVSIQPVRDGDGKPYAALMHASEITEKKRIEQEIERRNQIMEQARDLFSIADTQGRIIYMNQGGLDMLGIEDRDTVIGQPIPSFHPEEEQQRTMNEYLPQAAQTGYWRGENRLRRLDGTIINVEQTIFPIHNPDGSIELFATIISDITDRKRTQDALRQSESYLQSLINSQTSYVLRTDLNGRHTYWNQKFEETYGGIYATHGIGGGYALDSICEYHHDRARQVVERCIAEPGTIYKVELDKPTSMGTINTTFWEFVCLTDENGAPSQIQCMGVDITDRKRTEDALRQSERYLQSLLDSQTSYLIRVATDGTITYANRRYLDQFGWYVPNILGAYANDMILEIDREKVNGIVIECLRNPGTPLPVEIRKPARDGGVMYTLWEFIALVGDDGLPSEVQCVGFDISDLKRAEAEVIASQNRYRQMFELHGLPKLIIDPETALILDANPAAADFYGYDVATLRTKTMFDVSISSPEEVSSKMAQAATAQMLSCSFLHRAAGNQERVVEIFTGPIEVEGRQLLYSVVTDITDKEQTKAALEEANATLEKRVTERTAELERVKDRLEAIFHHSGDAILLIDIQHQIQQANYTFGTLFGVDREQHDRSFEAFFDAADRERIRQTIQQSVDQHETAHLEAKARRPDGSSFDVEVSIAPVNRSEKAVENLVCIVRDITERKQSQAIIAEERNLLRTVIDAVPDFIYVKDLEHRMLLNNQAHVRSFGLNNPADALGKTDLELFPQELALSFMADERFVFETGQSILNREERSLGEDGKPIWALTTKVPLYNLQGDLAGLVGITHDITRIKESEQALMRSEKQLRDSQQMLQTVLDTIPVRVFWKDRDLRYLGCNRLFAQDAGLPDNASITGKFDGDLVWGESAVEFNDRDRNVMATGIPQLDYEESFRISDNAEVFTRTNKLPLKDAEGNTIGLLGAYIDVTERKRADEALRRSEQRLELATQAGGIGIWDWDVAHGLMDWDDQMCKLYGVRREELTATVKDWDRGLHPDDHDRAQRDVEQALSGDRPFDTEFRVIHENGVVRHIKALATVFWDAEGNPIRMVGVNFDITEQKQTAEDLAKINNVLQTLQAVQIGFISHETPAESFGTLLAELLQFTESEYGFIGEVFYTEENQPYLKTQAITNIAWNAETQQFYEENAPQGMEFTNLNTLFGAVMTSEQMVISNHPASDPRRGGLPEGHPPLNAFLGVPMYSANGSMIGMMGIGNRPGGYDTDIVRAVQPLISTCSQLIEALRNVRERQVAEAALRSSEEKFRTFIEAAPIATVISDAEGMITLVNRAAEDMFGYKRDELMGQPVEILVPATNRDNHMNFRSVYYELPEQRRQGAMELSAMRRNGSQFPVDLQLSYVDLEPEPLVMSFLIDVTDRKLYEDYLKSALQQERELGELKSRFVSTASHEFRTPLATILAAAETLATFRGRMDDAQIDGRLNKIRQQVMHLKGIMDEVLQLARIQAGKVEFVPAPADFDGLCQEIIEEFETQDGNNDRIQYVTEFHPVPVMIDGRLMRQVVTNLISNALKYSGEQPIHVTIKRSNKQVVLTVIDQGIGIPPDDLKRLFEPFHRATNVGTISGTGLGLSIAKQAVELHGGAIRVESEVNVGSTFTVLLPLMDENP